MWFVVAILAMSTRECCVRRNLSHDLVRMETCVDPFFGRQISAFANRTRLTAHPPSRTETNEWYRRCRYERMRLRVRRLFFEGNHSARRRGPSHTDPPLPAASPPRAPPQRKTRRKASP